MIIYNTIYLTGDGASDLSWNKNRVTSSDTQYIRLDEAIAILAAEPETISSSTSYRQGYVRAINDKIKQLEALKQPEYEAR